MHSVAGGSELDGATRQSLMILLSSPRRTRLEDCSGYCTGSVGGTAVETSASPPLEFVVIGYCAYILLISLQSQVLRDQIIYVIHVVMTLPQNTRHL